jgi:hypothetical protein
MEDYASSMSYEIFIRRAHGCDRNQKGASLDYFRNLQNTETGRLKLATLGSSAKQLSAVNGYLEKALVAFIKPRRGRKLTPREVEQLEALLPRFAQSSSSAELLPLIEQGLEITQPYKDA